MFEVNDTVISVCKEAYERFVGNGLYIGIFFISILYLISNMRKENNKERKIKLILGIYSIIVLIINLTPIWTSFLTSMLRENATYWRVYWLLPIGISIAFMFTEIISKKDSLKDRMIISIVIIGMIVLSGKYMYNSEEMERFIKVENYYKVPNNVLDIINHVSADDNDYKKLAGTELFIIYTRQVDGNIILPEVRILDCNYGDDSIVTLIKEKKLKAICDYCTNKKCNYLVVNNDLEFPKEYILGYDIKELYKNNEYCLYKFNRIVENN